MIKNLLLSAVLLLSIQSAQAKSFELPEKKPAVSVNIPDSWKPDETDDGGVEAQSDDDGVYIAIQAVNSEKGMEAVLEGVFEMLKEHKVEFDKSKHKNNKFKIAGEDAEEMVFTGKDEDGPCTVSITLATVGGHVLVVTYWATDELAQKNQPAIIKIVKSIKAL